MRIAIMQPYFFPYLGYFQLIHAVDTFIYLDNVAFIKKGWIHRNRVYFNNRIFLFSIPLKNVSQYKTISEMEIAEREFSHWKKKFFSSLFTFYKKQPYFDDGFEILENVMSMPFHSIADLAINSIQNTCEALGLKVPVIRSSELGVNRDTSKEKFLIDICLKCHGDEYVNPPGGIQLYSQSMFTPHGIRLFFLQPNLSAYPVKNREFIPGLSILDVIMCCGKRYAKEHLFSGYGLREGE